MGGGMKPWRLGEKYANALVGEHHKTRFSALKKLGISKGPTITRPQPSDTRLVGPRFGNTVGCLHERWTRKPRT